MLNLISCSCHGIPSDVSYLIRKDEASKHLIDTLIRKLRERIQNCQAKYTEKYCIFSPEYCMFLRVLHK